MRSVLLFLLGSMPLFGQLFSGGIIAGVPLTDFLNAASSGSFNYSAPTQRYIIGADAELRLPLSLGVEFDLLYRRLSFTGSGTLPAGFVTAKGTGNDWEFPLLLKYRFPFPVVRPFVEGGVAWNALPGLKNALAQASQTLGLASPQVNHTTTMGVVLGGGVDIHAVFLHIQPQLRFTRWTAQQISDPLGLLQSNQNQAEFLVAFTF